jgi:GDPmannose 4,6-dehydratase
VREFVEAAFKLLDLDPDRHVRIDPTYFRPAEVDYLEGDASKARTKLGWEPTVGFDELVAMMVKADMALAERERVLADSGLAGRDEGSSEHHG